MIIRAMIIRAMIIRAVIIWTINTQHDSTILTRNRS